MTEIEILQMRIDLMNGSQAALFCAVKAIMASGTLGPKFVAVLDTVVDESRANLLALSSDAHLEGFEKVAALLTAQATGTPQS